MEGFLGALVKGFWEPLVCSYCRPDLLFFLEMWEGWDCSIFVVEAALEVLGFRV